MSSLILIASLLVGCLATEATSPETQLAPPNPVPTLTLEVSAILPGQRATWTIGGLQPGERVNLLRASSLQTPGPCFAIAGGLCLDISGGISLVSTVTANAAGVAVLSLPLPSNLTNGVGVTFQAVAVRGAGGSSSVKSVAVRRVIGAPLATPVADLLSGDLVVTEIMADPTLVSDTQGEWIELLNLSGETVDLNGLRISDGAAQVFTITTSLLVDPDEFIVLGVSTNTLTNGGVPVDLAWGNAFSLANTTDTVELSAGATVFDSVTYDGGVTFPQLAGATMSLDPSAWTERANDEGHAWCTGAAGGTPGRTNLPCPAAVCGDGAIGLAEECDDGGVVPGDGCDDLCLLEGCQAHELTVGTWHVSAPQARSANHDGRFTSDGGLLLASGDDFVGVTYSWRLEPDVWTADWASANDNQGSVARFIVEGQGGTAWVVDDAYWSQLSATGGATSLTRFSVHLGGTAYSQLVMGVEPTADGGLLVFGEGNSAIIGRDGDLLRVGGNGTLMWDIGFEYNGLRSYVGAARELRNGDIILTGSDGGTLFVTRLSSNGVVVWNRAWRAASSMNPQAVTEAPDGTIVVSGLATPNVFPYTDSLGLIIALSSTGTPLWARTLDAAADSDRTFNDVELWPGACDAGVRDRGVCTEAGLTCAGATTDEVCACDGARWSCAATGWQYVVGGSDGARLMAAHAFSTTGSGLWGRTYDDTAELYDLAVGAYGELRMVGGSTVDTFAIVATDAAQHVGCNENEVGTRALTLALVELSAPAILQTTVTTSPGLWTPSSTWVQTLTAECATSACTE
jgi:cysteine-rich repeat protein